MLIASFECMHLQIHIGMAIRSSLLDFMVYEIFWTNFLRSVGRLKKKTVKFIRPVDICQKKGGAQVNFIGSVDIFLLTTQPKYARDHVINTRHKKQSRPTDEKKGFHLSSVGRENI